MPSSRWVCRRLITAGGPAWRARPAIAGPRRHRLTRGCRPQAALANILLFGRLAPHIQHKVVAEMYEKTVAAGEILIKEGDTGAAASQLYVVKSGKFEVGGWCRSVAATRCHAKWAAGGGAVPGEAGM